ncbi:MAG: hypothetical protein E7293_06035 [Lachnospiraceae bacterium]|nr:hypothetical protein [Lachnospiraceae bacterium]
MKTAVQDIRDFVDQAELVLIGTGEEFERKKILEQDPEYCAIQEKIKLAQVTWVKPYVDTYWLRERMQDKVPEALQHLKRLIDGKNYFIVSTSMNGFLLEAGFKDNRMVEPCGSYALMQCVNGCQDSLEETSENFLEQIKNCCQGSLEWESLSFNKCAGCGGKKVFNNLYAEHYLEQGYLPRWNTYMKWLQGTVNRKVCIIELGEGLRYPSVIRWPFEKTAYLNKKAFFIRVHERLYQLTQEIGEQGYSIAQNAVDFLNTLEN